MIYQFRKYPYPYRAALTITNDIDGLSFETFLNLHDYLNTSNQTPVGRGLDLDISDSFWFVSAKSKKYDSFSFFEGLSTVRSKYAEAIQTLAELGYLDSLHTWGNFSEVGGYERKYAEQSAKELESWKRKPLIWMNHGDTHNHQNVSEINPMELDLLRKLGFVFFWTGEITPIWGHERKVTPNERIAPITKNLSWKGKLLFQVKERLNGNQYFPILTSSSLSNQVPIYFFTRYLRSWKESHSDDLEQTLSEPLLDMLEDTESMVSILIHFGFGQQFPQFTPGCLQGLKRLAERYHEKRIWVASSERFLLHLLAKKHLTVQQINSNSLQLSWDSSTPESVRGRGTKVFHELTIYIPSLELTQIKWGEQNLPFIVNPPDTTGQKSITIQTWKRPTFPTQDLCRMVKIS